MDKNIETWQQMLKESFGFTDEQLADEYDRLAKMAKEEEKDGGDYEALRIRIEKLYKEGS